MVSSLTELFCLDQGSNVQIRSNENVLLSGVNGQIPASFHITIQIKLEKSVDVLLGIRTKACRMDPLSYGGLNYRVNDIGSYSLL